MTVFVCTALLSAAAQAPSDSDTRSSILALEHAWDQAVERGDVKALAAIFDNSLVYIDFDGQLLTKAGYLERVKANATHIQLIVSEQMNVEVFGDVAVVVGIYRVKGVENGKAYLQRGRFVDTWVLSAGQWRCVAAGTTPVSR
jgi:ketosteroid isomerase-like protein